MKSKIATLAVMVLFGTSAFATQTAAPETASKPRSAQQQKMADCNKQAKGKRGDERKALMKACLSKKPTA